MMIQQITQRLHEVNTLLATCRHGDITFEQAMPLSLFYKDFNDTNRIVSEATAMFHDDAGLLMDISSSLLSILRLFFESLITAPKTISDGSGQAARRP